MTRENKIALVIGFAIMLVIGVLLSDHLAQTVRGPAADLSAINDPLSVPPGDSVEFLPLMAEDELASAPPQQRVSPELPDASDAAKGPTMHVVQAGETLRAIARAHYADADLAGALARHNRLPAPDRLARGLRLLIPPRSELPAETNSTPEPAPVANPMATYTVQSGDTLSQLAQKLMGTAKATDRLWALNKPTLSHPDALRVGMELKYPIQAGP
ncbi:MAG: LysM peptidoglycan-binding domain-containing protein [Phycisphaerales bacterium]|nr:LysM peptidoglycan-binding domain-containing protein [Phycisphaerales bacterium]